MNSTVDLPSMEVASDTSTGKTNHRYKNSYDAFVKWQTSNQITSFDEDVLLDYFTHTAKTYKSSSLWSMYSMLKSTLLHYNNVDISPYSRLTAFLKEKSVGFESKKFKVFSAEEINRFLAEAQDEHYLAMKTILVFGVTGGCKVEEIMNLKMDYVKDYGTEIIVKVPVANKDNPKIFMIGGDFAKIVQKYMQLRPANVLTDRFFLHYHRGQCECEMMSKPKVSLVPKEIAKFLKLDEYKSYTTHSFRSNVASHTVTETAKSRRNKKAEDASQASKRLAMLATSTNVNSNNAQITPQRHKPVPDTSSNTSCEITNVNSEQETSSETFPSTLPVTIALMKRKPHFYTGLEPDRLLRLLEFARQRKELNDIKILLALRKRRLNEEFGVLADLFDLDKATTERYYNESKHTVIDLVDLLPTATVNSRYVAPITNDFVMKTAPSIKTDLCKPSNPVNVEPIIQYNHESAGKMNEVDCDNADDHENGEDREDSDSADDDDDNDSVDDHDDFECNVSDEDRGFLSNDLRKRTDECPECHKLYTPTQLTLHLQNVHFNLSNLNKTICGLCWKEFDTKTLLKAHQQVIHRGCSHACDVCKKLFKSKLNMNVHILSKHTQNKTYLCDTCGEGFAVKNRLKYHVRSRHGNLGLDCHICNMKCVTANALRDHLCARHTKERPYKCEFTGCGKAFSWPSSLRSHQKTHLLPTYLFENDNNEIVACHVDGSELFLTNETGNQ